MVVRRSGDRREGFEETGLLREGEGEPVVCSIHVHGFKYKRCYRKTEKMVALKNERRVPKAGG